MTGPTATLALGATAAVLAPAAFAMMELSVPAWGAGSWSSRAAKQLYPSGKLPAGFPVLSGDLVNLLVMFFREVKPGPQDALMECLFSVFASGALSQISEAGRQASARARRGQARAGPTWAGWAAALFPGLAQFLSLAGMMPLTYRAVLLDEAEDGDLANEEVETGHAAVGAVAALVMAAEVARYQGIMTRAGPAGPDPADVRRFLIAPLLPSLALLVLPAKTDLGETGNALARRALLAANAGLALFGLFVHGRIFLQAVQAGGPLPLVRSFFGNPASAFLFFDFISGFASTVIWISARQERETTKAVSVPWWSVAARNAVYGLALGPGAYLALLEAAKLSW